MQVEKGTINNLEVAPDTDKGYETMKTYLVMRSGSPEEVREAIKRYNDFEEYRSQSVDKPFEHVNWRKLILRINAYPLWTTDSKAQAIADCRSYNKQSDDEIFGKRDSTFFYVEIEHIA